MELLVISDIHGKTKKLREIMDNSGEFDLVVLVGDLTDFGPRRKAEEVLEIIKDYTQNIIGVPGNCDPEGIEEVISQKAVLIDEEIARFDGYDFVGLGGSNETPFDTPRERSEKEIKKVLEDLFSEVGEKCVLVSHAPAQGYLDLTSGTHAGSESVLEVVREFRPNLVLSGHIHEAKGEEQLNETSFVNPGAARDGDFAKIELNEEVNTKFLSY